MSHGYEPTPASDRRLDRRTYTVRRLGVLAAAIGVVVAVLSGVPAIFGRDDTNAVLVSSVTNTVIDDGVTPITLTPTTTTELPLKPLEVPSRQNPAEVLILGDSDAGGFGPYLQQTIDQTGVATATVHSRQSSGLARPDYFDWPTRMRELVQHENPDIVVATFGGNDAQGLRNADKTWAVPHSPGSGHDDTDWKAEYARRVGAAMDYLSKGNRMLIWVGIPNDNNPAVTARLEVQDGVVRAEALKRRGKVLFVDTWALFGGPNGGWAEYVVDPRDGQGKAVRRSDGFHLNDVGGQILAVDIADVVKSVLRARGATL